MSLKPRIREEERSQVYAKYSLLFYNDDDDDIDDIDGLRENLVVGTWSNDGAREFLLCQSMAILTLHSRRPRLIQRNGMMMQQPNQPVQPINMTGSRELCRNLQQSSDALFSVQSIIPIFLIILPSG